MKDIIAAANEKRFKPDQDEPKKKSILITDNWLAELQKYPFHSSKIMKLTLLEKPGTGIYFMKEHAKLYRATGKKNKHELAKKMNDQLGKDEEMK